MSNFHPKHHNSQNTLPKVRLGYASVKFYPFFGVKIKNIRSKKELALEIFLLFKVLQVKKLVFGGQKIKKTECSKKSHTLFCHGFLMCWNLDRKIF